MSEIKDIPAFPCVIRDRQFPNNNELERLPGMTLRDYFAGQALIGLLQRPPRDEMTYDKFAGDSYIIADVMLEERSK